MNNFFRLIRLYQASITALTVLLILVLGSYRYSTYRKGLWEKDVRANLQEVLIGKKSALEKELYSRIYYTRGVAAYVSMNPKISNEEYDRLAREFIQDDEVISTMALSKGGIISAIYPLQGHESAIGLNLLEHPERRLIVEETIKTHQTFVAGPVDLVEGGVAFISYTPIFDKTQSKENDFWGMTDIVILKNKLLAEAGLNQEDDEFIYALRGYNGMGEVGAVFWGNQEVFSRNPVSISIQLPTGSWLLAAIPQKGWQAYFDQDKSLFFALIICSIIISILLWLFSNALIRIKRKERELTAIFRSMDTLVIEFNQKGEYLKIAPTNNQLLYKPADQLIGKSVHDIFDKEHATLFLESIQKCLREQDIVVTEYSLEINGKLHWFSVRISNKSSNTVIFNVHDISDLKWKEENILNTSKELADLNAMKDKFFSIIAHDLRGPINSYRSLTDILVERYPFIEDETRIELIKNMQNSSLEVSNLLENLLIWANSQGGRLKIDKQDHLLNEVVNSVISTLKINSDLKQIELKNEVPEKLIAYIDFEFTSLILRNLISNAIKFSEENGMIRITAENTNNELTIRVIDNGIGIPKKRISQLFHINHSRSTKGTMGESGNGLGLILCKEFVEKQGGEIFVKSEENVGTTFSFTLPPKNK